MKNFLYKMIVCLYNLYVLDISTAFNNTTNKFNFRRFICCVIFFCWMLLELLVSLIIFFIFLYGYIYDLPHILNYFLQNYVNFVEFCEQIMINYFEETEEKPWIYQIVEEKICSYIDIWIFLGNDYIYLYYMINSIFFLVVFFMCKRSINTTIFLLKKSLLTICIYIQWSHKFYNFIKLFCILNYKFKLFFHFKVRKFTNNSTYLQWCVIYWPYCFFVIEKVIFKYFLLVTIIYESVFCNWHYYYIFIFAPYFFIYSLIRGFCIFFDAIGVKVLQKHRNLHLMLNYFKYKR